MKIKSFAIGFLVGLLVTWFVLTVTQGRIDFPGEMFAAHIGGDVISESALKQKISVALIPVENDRYRLLYQAASNWVEQKVLEKEAKEKNFSIEELLAKEVWSKVTFAAADVQAYYDQNKQSFNQPFEAVKNSIWGYLRQRKFIEVKKQYVAGLEKKFHAGVTLKKPETLVPNWDFPQASIVPAAPTVAAPAAAVATKAPAIPSNGLIPSRGPENAKITIQEFADFKCFYCKKSSAVVKQIAQAYPQDVRIVFRNYPLSNEPGQGSYLFHEGGACAQEQGKFWEYYDEIFSSTSTAAPEVEIKAAMEKIKLDEMRFDQCMRSGKYRSFIESERAAGKASGVIGTPTFFINDQIIKGAYPFENFSAIIQGILDPSKAAPAPAAPKVEAPAPQPDRVIQFDDLDGKPSMGPKDAPVTIVEFSDFHCPFCQRVNPTLDQVMKNFKGKVRLVWRHFPLPMHEGSAHTHEASQCAAEQGKFWEYHDKLFSTEASDHTDETLNKMAAELKLHKKKFKDCLASGKYKDLIQKEIQKGESSGVNGTPAFFINGKVVFGALPYASFEELIKKELDGSKKS